MMAGAGGEPRGGHDTRGAGRVRGRSHGAITMPLCVYLCYTPGCQTKIDRWMRTAEEGGAAKMECPRCGVVMTCAWTGSQQKTPNMKDSSAALFTPKS
jgi:hypothetical protein